MKSLLNNVFKKILNTKNKLNIAKNSAWLIFSHGIKIIFGLFVGIWVARYLGPADFGKLSYVLALVSLFIPLARSGLDVTVPKELIHKKENQEKIISAVFFLKLIGGILVFILTLTIAYLFHSNDKVILILSFFIGVSYIFKSFEALDIWFLTKLKSKYTVIAKNTGLLASSLLKILFILSGFSLIYFGLAITVEAFITTIVLIFIFYKTESQINFKNLRFSFNDSFNLLKISWVFIFIEVLYVMLFSIDKIMIENIIGSYEVGLYSVAVNISLSFIFIACIITHSAYPVLLTLDKDRAFENFIDDYQKLFNYLVLLAYIIIIVTFLSSNFIVPLLWGSEYQFSSKILSIQIFSIIFIFLGTWQGLWIVMKNLTKFFIISFFVGIIANLILNYLLLTQIGVIGAAYATVISFFLIYILAGLFYSKTRQIFKMQIKALFIIDFWYFVYKKLFRNIFNRTDS